jgi:hypothetical protein
LRVILPGFTLERREDGVVPARPGPGGVTAANSARTVHGAAVGRPPAVCRRPKAERPDR